MCPIKTSEAHRCSQTFTKPRSSTHAFGSRCEIIRLLHRRSRDTNSDTGQSRCQLKHWLSPGSQQEVSSAVPGTPLEQEELVPHRCSTRSVRVQEATVKGRHVCSDTRRVANSTTVKQWAKAREGCAPSRAGKCPGISLCRSATTLPTVCWQLTRKRRPGFLSRSWLCWPIFLNIPPQTNTRTFQCNSRWPANWNKATYFEYSN